MTKAPKDPLGRGPIRLAHDNVARNESLLISPVGIAHLTLRAWYEDAKKKGEMHDLVSPDFHRLQLENWIKQRAMAVMGTAENTDKAIDFGVILRRAWQDARYITAGVSGKEDVRIDLCAPQAVSDQYVSAFRLVICSEVLEHVENPHLAMRTLTRLLAPGGTLLLTSPFLWPDHATQDYPDYWRFTEGAWRLLVRNAGLTLVGDVQPCMWSYDGGHLYELLRRVEGWGFGPYVEGHTGYLVEATKAIGNLTHDEATGEAAPI